MKHPFRIYTVCRDGKHLLMEGDYCATEEARKACLNIHVEEVAPESVECPDVTQKSIFGDSANKIAPLPDDSKLFKETLPSWNKARILLDDVLAGGGIGIF